MSNDDDYLKTRFTLASHLNENQKRYIEITRLRDEKARGDLIKKFEEGKRILRELREKQEKEKKEVIKKETSKRISAAGKLSYEMRGGERQSPHQIRSRIEQEVERQFGEKNDREFENARKRINEAIDKGISEASRHEASQSWKQQFRDNAGDIGIRQNRGRGGRGQKI